MSQKKLVFSGVQPTGNLHLGNYLGTWYYFGYFEMMSTIILEVGNYVRIILIIGNKNILKQFPKTGPKNRHN